MSQNDSNFSSEILPFQSFDLGEFVVRTIQDLPADAPITRRLSGILSQQVNIEDYKEHLVEKYGS